MFIWTLKDVAALASVGVVVLVCVVELIRRGISSFKRRHRGHEDVQ